MRVNLEGDPSVVALLRRVRETTLSAYANQDVPFERLVEELRPPRNPARAPLCQVLIALQNVRGMRTTLTGIELEPLSVGASKASSTSRSSFWESR